MLCIQKNLTLQVIIKNVNIALNFSPSTIYLRSEVSPADPFLTSSDRPSHPSSFTLAALICICRAFSQFNDCVQLPFSKLWPNGGKESYTSKKKWKKPPLCVFLFGRLWHEGNKKHESFTAFPAHIFCQENRIGGGMIGGSKIAIAKWAKLFYKTLER